MSERISNIHPGEILEEDFLKPLSISAYRLAKETHIPPTRISEILKHRRRISADTALRFSKYFGNSPDFWLGIQMEYDLREEKEKHKTDIDTIKTIEIAV